MRLAVVSHKPCWPAPDSPSGYATDGGFPFQMAALSELFDQTTLVVPVHRKPAPSGASPLQGRDLSVVALGHPAGTRRGRKLSLLLWMPRNMPRIWNAIHHADAVHTPVPGDIGLIGIFFSLLQRKPLFVRHCGTWSKTGRFSRRFLIWLLEHIAGGKNIVLATGGGNQMPSPDNPAIRWIFATSMPEAKIRAITPKVLWQPGQTLRLVTVARQEPGKNTDRVIRALPLVAAHIPRVTLDIVGEGSALATLRELAAELNVAGQVTFHGRLDHRGVMRVLSQGHVFCFPSDSEGFPKAVHEALSWGLPVIATRVSVLPVLVGTENGILLDDIEPETIASAIVSLIADNKRLAEIVRNAQETARAYSLENWRDCIGEHLQAAWHRSLREHEV